MKTKVDKLDVDKLVLVPVDSGKLNDLVKNNVFKKDVYNAKIKNIEDKVPDITNLATNASFNAKINEAKDEVHNIANLATNFSLDAKVNKVKSEIPNVTNLATTTALTSVENKIPNISNLVKKTDHSTKSSETENKITDHDHDKYITTPEFHNLTAENFAARLKQANLASKSDIANFIKKMNKNELNELSKKGKAISTKGLTKHLINKFSILNGANIFL